MPKETRSIDGTPLPERLDRVHTTARRIGSSVWARAWCDNLERHGDFENRLPRGRTYLRKGAVWHVEIERGVVRALVRGTRLYEQRIEIEPLSEAGIDALRSRCAGQVRAAFELLRGQLPASLLEALRDPKEGLLPEPGELKLSCSCPDWATLCKHLAAVLYGVGVRLDANPELLFALRGVDAEALVNVALPDLAAPPLPRPSRRLRAEDPMALFDLGPEQS